MLNKQAAAHYDAANGYARDAAHGAARALCRFLKEQRRTREVLKDDPFPRVRDVTAAFLLLLPASALSVLSEKVATAYGKIPAPPPPAALLGLNTACVQRVTWCEVLWYRAKRIEDSCK